MASSVGAIRTGTCTPDARCGNLNWAVKGVVPVRPSLNQIGRDIGRDFAICQLQGSCLQHVPDFSTIVFDHAVRFVRVVDVFLGNGGTEEPSALMRGDSYRRGRKTQGSEALPIANLGTLSYMWCLICRVETLASCMRGPGAFVVSTVGSGVLQDVMPFCGSARAFTLQLPRLVQSGAECVVVALSSFAHRFGSDACRGSSRSWSMIMSWGRSPSRRSRSGAPRKGYSRHRPLAKPKALCHQSGERKRLEQVKHFISEHCDFGELKDVQRETLKRNHYVTGYPRRAWIRATGHANECEVGMGDGRVRTETLLQRLTQRHRNSDSRRFLLQFCHEGGRTNRVFSLATLWHHLTP